MLTPIQRFRPTSTTTPETLPASTSALDPPPSGDDWVSRKVAANGIISVAWHVFSVGRHYSGEIVDVHVGDQLLEVWHRNDLIKTVLRRSQHDVRKKNAETTPGTPSDPDTYPRRRKPSTEAEVSNVK